VSDAQAAAGRLHKLIDRLAAEHAEIPHRGEIERAREDYFDRAGRVFEDDAELFEARMASFLEWYVLDRPLAGGEPPVLRALARALEARQVEEARTLAYLVTSHRSLFDVAAVSGKEVQLDDVLGGARFRVVERRSTVGFEVGDLVEARLLWDGTEVIFGKTFLFHPRDARAEALAAVAAAAARGTDRDEILFQLSRLHVRWHRHGHVNAARVYRGGA
jgi:hypothetical protein